MDPLLQHGRSSAHPHRGHLPRSRTNRRESHALYRSFQWGLLPHHTRTIRSRMEHHQDRCLPQRWLSHHSQALHPRYPPQHRNPCLSMLECIRDLADSVVQQAAPWAHRAGYTVPVCWPDRQPAADTGIDTGTALDNSTLGPVLLEQQVPPRKWLEIGLLRLSVL